MMNLEFLLKYFDFILLFIIYEIIYKKKPKFCLSNTLFERISLTNM